MRNSFQASVDKEMFLKLTEQDAKIDRLREDLAIQLKQVELWEIVTENKDAEIKKLKSENEITVRVCNENTDLKRLVSELCDALQRIPIGLTPLDRELVQRAREATR